MGGSRFLGLFPRSDAWYLWFQVNEPTANRNGVSMDSADAVATGTQVAAERAKQD